MWFSFISKSTRLRSLLQQGYFPSELPLPFNTQDLGKYRSSILRSWSKTLSQTPKTVPGTFSIPKGQFGRRHLRVVNPISQTYLSELIANNWIKIRNHLIKSQYSASKLEIRSTGGRAVDTPDFQSIEQHRLEISAEYNFALVSDVSRFYGTLYTHTLAWALHGKQWSKVNINSPALASSLGNQLDIAVRKGQDNQTLGIPIGPDTSRILSEIIASSVDQNIQKSNALKNARAIRNVDDWFIGFDSLGAAEKAINHLDNSYRTFELELNAEKTKTISTDSVYRSVWVQELTSILSRMAPKPKKPELFEFFTNAFHLQQQHPHEHIVLWAVKSIRSKKIQKSTWPTFETFLLKTSRQQTASIPVVVQILSAYSEAHYPINVARCAKLIEDTIAIHSPRGHHFEVSWVLYLAVSLNISLSKRSCELVSNLENSICAIVALHLQSLGLAQYLNVNLWKTYMTADSLKSDMWLLAYEADLKGWLSGTPTNFVDNDFFFGVLKQKNISFYIANKRYRLPSNRPSLLDIWKKLRLRDAEDMNFYGFTNLRANPPEE
ncbi:RNA-directed DNA polymerase [Thalassospira lucentensis]|uniref:RNA-directed DNA polymerase n=1 Tax=Thalassospira lucentensis TaxID=168935 RepID=UPI002941E668|nr:RNA-directed DNA polymerase [Thalassospira lucentensis]WOI12788.1 RNA-directed DNA polymerase [Thalassospira lucentensis]